MDDEKAWRDLNAVAWAHVGAERFDEAEVAIRELIDRTDLQYPLRLGHLFGLLAGVLNVLERPEEGTEMYRRALAEARRAGPSNGVEVARYMLANRF
jgi:hypothetical protein